MPVIYVLKSRAIERSAGASHRPAVPGEAPSSAPRGGSFQKRQSPQAGAQANRGCAEAASQSWRRHFGVQETRAQLTPRDGTLAVWRASVLLRGRGAAHNAVLLIRQLRARATLTQGIHGPRHVRRSPKRPLTCPPPSSSVLVGCGLRQTDVTSAASCGSPRRRRIRGTWAAQKPAR